MNKSIDNDMLISKLLDLTEAGHLKWKRIPDYLDEQKNESLRIYIIGANKYFYSRGRDYKWPLLQEYGSYCAEINGGLFILFLYNTEDGKTLYELALQTIVGRMIEKKVYNYEYQERLSQLWESAKADGKSLESFLSDLFE